jgi:hypothetical protein
MKVGMLWFDNDQKTDLFTKITRAATYYQDKYGQNPNNCYVHPNMVASENRTESEDQSIKAGDVEVHLTNLVLPNHLWIGIGTSNGNLVS